MSEDRTPIRAGVGGGVVTITISAARMFDMLEGSSSGRSWTNEWWERNVSPVVYAAMSNALSRTGAFGEAEGSA